MANEDQPELALDDVGLVQEKIDDDASAEERKHKKFTITSYGADYPVETLVSRVNKGDFYLPDFQRSYVWSLPQASRFVESLLLGLPIPSLFLFREPDTSRHLIIDGQQRLRTLQYFKNGTFRDKVFRLVDVSDPWNGKSYKELAEEDQRRLDDAVIHSIIFRQDAPEADNSSIYEVFERLNSGGMKLSAQEIRVCVSHGKFVELLYELNKFGDWRSIYGEPSPRGKDQELVLRFLALKFDRKNYAKPMKTFLDGFLHRHKDLPEALRSKYSTAFTSTVSFAEKALGKRAFRPERNLNTAVFDSIMVGLSEALDQGKRDPDKIKVCYEALLADADYKAAYLKATSDEDQVTKRVNAAVTAFLAC